MKKNIGDPTPVEEISLKDACSRYAFYAQKIAHVVAKDREAKLEKEYLKNLVYICRGDAKDLEENLNNPSRSARESFEMETLVEKQLGFALNAMILTYNKGRPLVEIAKADNKLTDQVSQSVLAQFDNPENYIELLGNRQPGKLSAMMKDFTESLPKSKIYTMNHEKAAKHQSFGLLQRLFAHHH